MPTLRERIRAHIVEELLMGKPLEAADEDSLMEAGVMDSTGAMEMAIWLDETFGVIVPDDEMTPENLDSVAGIESYITRKQAT